ncbi:MAG: hypothetical protein H7Y60_10995 [Rhodospirillaceae bacterium]|nr:hypothetical protein [Rhodospirillales bacterium]
MGLAAAAPTEKGSGKFPKAKDACTAAQANEILLGVVGHVGSGTGFVAKKLKLDLADLKRGYQVEVIKASNAIRMWAEKKGLSGIPMKGGRSIIEDTEKMQTRGSGSHLAHSRPTS